MKIIIRYKNRFIIAAISLVLITLLWFLTLIYNPTQPIGTKNIITESEGSIEQNYNIICYENVVALTFDDGPYASTTPKLLDGLKERGVKATFFLIGENAVKNEAIVKRMYEEGHLIGNHTYSHISLSSVSHDNALYEINKTNEVISNITGYTCRYIRPPYGNYSKRMYLEIDMQPILWSVDPNDWNTDDAGKTVQYVVSHVKGGDIILLHDIYDSSVTAALEIVDRLKEKGFVFVTADELLLD